MNLADENPTFTILLVDDNPDSMKSQIKEARDYLKEKNLDLKVLEDRSGRKIETHLHDEVVDIILLDNKISESHLGIDLFKTIRKADPLVDILFYSGKPGQEETFEKARHYIFTEVVEGRKIILKLKKLIEKNLSKWNDIYLLRGVVISKIIDLELEINSFFEKYFNVHAEKVLDFHNFVLENKYNSLEGKKQTLTKIYEKRGLRKTSAKLRDHLDTLQKERNLLAHCKKHPDKENCLISMGNEVIFDKKRIDCILAKVIEARKEFDSLSQAVFASR